MSCPATLITISLSLYFLVYATLHRHERRHSIFSVERPHVLVHLLDRYFLATIILMHIISSHHQRALHK